MAPIPKCYTCNKIITKKAPCLECSVCKKVVHATTPCATLTTKQIIALRAQVSLDWTCNDCLKNRPRHRSFIVPEEDSEEEEGVPASYSQPVADTPGSQTTLHNIDIKKLLKDISKEVEKTVAKALEPLTDKMDEICENIEVFQQRIIELERKNASLIKANKNMVTRLCAVEQRVHELEQGQFKNHVEISGLPTLENEDPIQVVRNLAKKLNVEDPGVITAKRVGNYGEKNRTYSSEAQEGKALLLAAKSANCETSTRRSDTQD
ncbi:unnamed protein product [Parnassius mnemosyne]|uniref:Uncharacterized protein n=1 Tax=Parnassius mnemosyne TaxID=213953 RepID=A0AAV1L296_9NEOP